MNLKEALELIDALKKANKKEFTQHHYNRLKSVLIQISQSELISAVDKHTIYNLITNSIEE